MEVGPEAVASPPGRPVAAVLAVVVRGEEVILVRRANPPDAGLWGFPGGKIEPGEPITDAAVRELHEETCVTARAVEVFTAVDAIGNGPAAHHYVLIAVLCAWLAGDPVAADDALEARWFDLATLLSAETLKSFAVDSVAMKAVSLMRHRTSDNG